jgi:hypothetical protein
MPRVFLNFIAYPLSFFIIFTSYCEAAETLKWPVSVVKNVQKSKEGRKVKIEILGPSVLVVSISKRLSVRFERSDSPTLFYLNKKPLELTGIESRAQLHQHILACLPKVATRSRNFWIDQAEASDKETISDLNDFLPLYTALAKIVGALTEETLRHTFCGHVSNFALVCFKTLGKLANEISTIQKTFELYPRPDESERDEVAKSLKVYQNILQDLEVKIDKSKELSKVIMRIAPDSSKDRIQAFHQCSCEIDGLTVAECAASPTVSAKSPVLACIQQAQLLTTGELGEGTEKVVIGIRALIESSKELLAISAKTEHPTSPLAGPAKSAPAK